jgi:FMN reductase (NADPH)
MAHPTIDLIYRHSSVRSYKPDPIPVAMIEQIVSAAQHASTSSSLQAYSIIAVTENSKRQELAELCGDQDHIRQAPLFLTWCADLSRMDHICSMRGYTQITDYTENFLIAAFDALLASQNAALAAESFGLGICFIGSIRRNPEEVINLLDIPKLVFPVVGMTVGWPSQEPQLRPRLPLDIVLHWERYNRTINDEELNAYDQAMIATGIYKNIQGPVQQSSSQTEDIGWLEISARRVSRADRTLLRNSIEKQGFKMK